MNNGKPTIEEKVDAAIAKGLLRKELRRWAIKLGRKDEAALDAYLCEGEG